MLIHPSIIHSVHTICSNFEIVMYVHLSVPLQVMLKRLIYIHMNAFSKCFYPKWLTKQEQKHFQL